MAGCDGGAWAAMHDPLGETWVQPRFELQPALGPEPLGDGLTLCGWESAETSLGCGWCW